MKISTMQLIGLILSLTVITAQAASHDKFCWKDSAVRGAGAIPTGCKAGQTNESGLCYTSCPAGMTGVGPVCWSQCPSGYTDMGAVCHINLPLTVAASWVCTEHWPDWLGGGCRWSDTTCPAGYTNAGLFCALSARSTPAGFSGTYLDPMKNTATRGAGIIPQGCNAGNEYNAGLCYPPCQNGYYGVGPVCWSHAPKTWAECGMGAADTATTCATTIFGQVTSVLQLAAFVATLGSSGAADEAANGAQDAGKLAQLKDKFNTLKTTFTDSYPQIVTASQNAQKAGKVAVAGYTAADVAMKLAATDANTPPEDMVRIAAEAASLIDPSGVSGVVAAYTYPKCSVLFH
ncbi:MAG: hypothetical protein M3Y27_24315 [Acidobacteriota bacterium]|nr:hypothetical protein [Acidobacteriota bacterium]